MKEIMNSWRNDPWQWMNPENWKTLQSLWDKQKYTKKRFTAMKFHLLGNGALVDSIIRCNLCGVVQSTDIQKFYRDWKDYMLTYAYKEAKDASEQKQPGHVRRAMQIWTLKQKISRGKWISDWIDEAHENWYQLNQVDRDLYHDYKGNVFQMKLWELLRTPPGIHFPGAGSNISRMYLLTS